jgi:hypothetical protein
MSNNTWVTFLRENGKKGHNIDELRTLYYNLPRNNLGQFIEFKEFENNYPEFWAIDKKIHDQYELNDDEAEIWKHGFKLSVSDDFIFTKDQLLNSKNWWLTKLDRECNLDRERLRNFKNIADKKHQNVNSFLDDVMVFFSIEELACIGIN